MLITAGQPTAKTNSGGLNDCRARPNPRAGTDRAARSAAKAPDDSGPRRSATAAKSSGILSSLQTTANF